MARKDAVSFKGKVKKEYATGFSGGFFNPLKPNQSLQLEFIGERVTDSNFKSSVEDPRIKGKKKQIVFDFRDIKDGSTLTFNRPGGGPFLVFLEDQKPKDRVFIQYRGLKREDGEFAPATLADADKKDVKRWKQGMRCFPSFDRLAKL